jgi:hypothetical protein
MKDNLNSIQIQDNHNILENGRKPQTKIMQPKTTIIKTMVVAPLRLTKFLSFKQIHEPLYSYFDLWLVNLHPPLVQRKLFKTNQISNQLVGLKFQSNQISIKYFDISEMITQIDFWIK